MTLANVSKEKTNASMILVIEMQGLPYCRFPKRVLVYPTG